MLGKSEMNCPWGCCSDYNYGQQKESRRRARRQEEREWRKDWEKELAEEAAERDIRKEQELQDEYNDIVIECAFQDMHQAERDIAEQELYRNDDMDDDEFDDYIKELTRAYGPYGI